MKKMFMFLMGVVIVFFMFGSNAVYAACSSGPGITTSSLPNGVVGIDYAQTIQVSRRIYMGNRHCLQVHILLP